LTLAIVRLTAVRANQLLERGGRCHRA